MTSPVKVRWKKTPLLRCRGVCKSFNGVTALKDIDLDLFPGEILGLAGDNGAGKSTLIKILAGVHAPDVGRLEIDGRQVDFRTFDVRKARALGVETVFQDRSLWEKQPLWRNIFAGRPITNRLGFIRVRDEKRFAMDILRSHVGLRSAGLTPDARIRHLSGGERQGLAIGRAMHFDARIIILDEPTTALAMNEAERTLAFMERAARQGKACIYISHNMGHVWRVASRIVLMDRGQIVEEHFKGDISLEELGVRLLNAHMGVV